MKVLIPIVLIGGVGAAVVLVARKAKAAPPIPTTAPTVKDIMRAQSVAELNAYYRLISELLIIGKISSTKYRTLYDAYYERWYQLVGVA